MRKSNITFVLIVLIVGGYLLFASDWGRKVFSNLFGEDRGVISQMSLAFMEDIKFKDFNKAASYHHPQDREKADIPKLIERLFKIKPEMLDIMDYRVLETTLDSSGSRGRVKVRSKVNLLNQDRIEQPEMLLYFHKRDGAWYMELESSLK